MGDQAITNRDNVEAAALAIVFPTDKSGPIVSAEFANKTGTVSYSSVRKALKASQPDLTGDALTKRVGEIVNAQDATVLAGVLQLHREGFHFTKMNGRQLRSGTRNVTVAMSNRTDAKAPKAKKVEELSVAELQELLAIRQKLEAAAATPVIDV